MSSSDNSAAAREYWGNPIIGDKVSHTFARLIVSIFEYLRATSKFPPPPAAPHIAHPYLSPDMVTGLFELLQIKDLSFSEAEESAFGSVEELDDAFEEWYKCWELTYEKHPRSDASSPNQTMALLPRASLQNFIIVLALAEPSATHTRFNNLLSNARSYSEGMDTNKILLLDPITDRPFEYPQIPRECFPRDSDAVPDLIQSVRKSRERWYSKKQQILAQARARRIPPPRAGMPVQNHNQTRGIWGMGDHGRASNTGGRGHMPDNNGAGDDGRTQYTGGREDYGRGQDDGGAGDFGQTQDNDNIGMEDYGGDQDYEGQLALARADSMAAQQEAEAVNYGMAVQGSVFSDDQYVWETTSTSE